MPKPLIYVETSVISYLAARPSRDLITAARQEITREWWDIAFDLWDVAISELVIEEAARGDPVAASRRLEAIRTLQVLPAEQEAQLLAARIIEIGAVPETEPEDALHVAIATTFGARYLVTWNFAHLVGPERKLRLLDSLRGLGEKPALVTTPEELLETVR